ncbi:MAG: right-handed parallel beta-helix repeat-containing protein [Burkholderiaceae bacterium]|nr:right-handed parallel beta-helix repeat-containing protein [Burkholderiaceae bacterium]
MAILTLLPLAAPLFLALALAWLDVAPRLLGAHLARRADGHAPWIEAIGRQAHALLQWLDRGALLPQPQLPPWAGARAGDGAGTSAGRRVPVAAERELVAALAAARPGDVITIAPGTYRFSGLALEAARAGTAEAPIVVRAERLGTVRLEFALLEGFRISAPYWRFENLQIRGVCHAHDDCEHAFHVVGAAHHVAIRHNEVQDFNAHVKINGDAARYPDHGHLERNTLSNTRPRRTARPVTAIDLVAASGWTIEDNLIVDFVRAGEATSYGAFAKGGGSGNRFLRNVVLCEWRLRGAPGSRVGLSFGGGGSGAQNCRGGRCVVEHDAGLMEANLIASCSDEGIYVNRAARTRLVHNTVLDTAGVYVRYAESSAEAIGNLVDGPLRAGDGARLHERDNVTSATLWPYLGRHPVRARFVDMESLHLRFREPPPRRATDVAVADLCGRPRMNAAYVGAFDDFTACLGATARQGSAE